MADILPMEPVYLEAEVAEMLRVDIQVIRRERYAGRLGFIRVGGQVRIRKSDLERYRARGTPTEAGAEPPGPSWEGMKVAVEKLAVRLPRRRTSKSDSIIAEIRAGKYREARCVYFIDAGAAIKIGVATDPGARLREIQVGNHCRLTLLGTVSGGMRLEKAIHAELMDHRANGEWFKATKPVRKFIALVMEAGSG
jgi:excisionase family DNA binding protein